MEVINLIKECLKDCMDVIEKRVQESETMLDDMVLFKIKQVFDFIRKKI